MDGTLLAHVEGGVPNMMLRVPARCNEQTLGELIYFFEYACGLSGYLLDVNPFDQPGVEAYKKNMFALLGKPGYEELRSEPLREKLEKQSCRNDELLCFLHCYFPVKYGILNARTERRYQRQRSDFLWLD